MTNKIYIHICLAVVLGLGVMTVAQADLVVKSEYQSIQPYGNGELVCFRDALAGVPPSAAEIATLESQLPEREVGRYYGRLDLMFENLTLSSLRNRSTSPFQNSAILRKKASKSQTGLDLAIGYVFAKDFRGELEYLVNKNFSYTSQPIFTTVPSGQISSLIKNNTVLFTFYYDFLYDRFRPYVMGSLGASSNDVTTNVSPALPSGSSFTRRVVQFSWGVGVGFRVSIFTRWFMDFNYRYVQLGNPVKIQPNSNILLQGVLGMSAISAGLMYLF